MKKSHNSPNRKPANAGAAAPKAGNRTHIMFRFFLITMGIGVFAFAIAFQLFKTTVVYADKWNEKASIELERIDTILPVRGDILACDGSVLATNLQYYDVRIDFGSEAFAQNAFIDSLPKLCRSLATHFPQRSYEEWNALLIKQATDSVKSRSFKLLSQITYDQLQLVKSFPFLNLDNRYKSGLIEESFMKRTSPYGAMARRSIGRVGQTAECKEIHGISGLEKALDSLLFGVPGTYKRVPFTRRIGNWTDVPALDGYTVTTTIDITLQDILEQELNARLDTCGAEWGTAVLMEVATGDIKAISNLQRDANGNYIEAFNRAVVAYEPGSVIKPISMMIALEDGLVNDLNEVIPIGHSWAYGGTPAITDSHYSASLKVIEVIEQSSNIGMTRIITRGYDSEPAAFARRLESIGFGEKMYSGIYEEEKPRFSRKPKRIDLARMCYGYTTAIPPLYTLSVYNAIANDGRYVRPRLVKALSRNGVDSILPVTYIRESICSPENAAKMRTMLKSVVHGVDPDPLKNHGTGRRLINPYVTIAGKTGTSYDINFETKQYDRSKKRLAFCGFFPAEEPKYSMFVLMFHPTKNFFGAASTSGEVLKNVALKLYARGLLGHASDPKTDAPQNPMGAVFNASLSNDYTSLATSIEASNPQKLKAPEGSAPDTNVPSVVNLSFREAVAILEKAGYSVTFSGTGHVVSQSLSPDGSTVMLTLSYNS